MPEISTCPRCRLQISLPQKLSPAAQVKCPLCSAEYTLQEALDQAPPMLIVLDPGPLVPASESCVMSEAAVGAGVDACSTGMLPQVEFPADGADDPNGLPHFANDEDVETRVPLGEEAPDEGGAMLGVALREGDAQEQADGQADDQADSEAPDGDSRVGVLRVPRRAPRSSGGIGEMLKAVGGAVVGLSIGYYILLWLGKDPLLLKPLLSGYLPAWLLP